MRRFSLLLSLVLAITTFCACIVGCSSANQKDETDGLPPGTQEAFLDSRFEKGFWVGSLEDGDTQTYGILETSEKSDSPVWTLKQWYSKYDIAQGSRMIENGNYVFRSQGLTVEGETLPAKIFSVNPQTRTFSLECNTEAEYDRPLQQGEGWPHLLISQDITPVRLSTAKSLRLSLSYTVTKCDDRILEGQEQQSDSAACILYFHAKNCNEASADYNNYFWFGVRLFDNRYIGKVTKAYEKEDGNKEQNTGKFIYSLSSRDYLQSEKMPAVGENITIDIDLTSLLSEGFTSARSHGYLGATQYGDLYLTYANIGWEITARYNASITIQNLSLQYE